MQLYRIAHKRHIDDLSGMGKSYERGGRWNAPGHPVLYFGTSASVAMLEMGNYMPTPRMVPRDFVIGIFEVEDPGVARLALEELPQGWDDFPYPASTQRLGSDFLSRGEHLVLRVPSTASSGLEDIAVVNPRHQDISRLRLITTKSTIYNPRLFAGL